MRRCCCRSGWRRRTWRRGCMPPCRRRWSATVRCACARWCRRRACTPCCARSRTQVCTLRGERGRRAASGDRSHRPALFGRGAVAARRAGQPAALRGGVAGVARGAAARPRAGRPGAPLLQRRLLAAAAGLHRPHAAALLVPPAAALEARGLHR